jgi:hypothetical protein
VIFLLATDCWDLCEVNGVSVSVNQSEASASNLAGLMPEALFIERLQQAAWHAVNPPSEATVAPAINRLEQAARPTVAKRYAIAFLFATLAGMVAIWFGNQAYAPEMYGDGGMAPAAEAHANHKNYAVFDLNLNIRALREEQLKRMTKTPDIILLGASHWQEGNKSLVKGQDLFNSHIHRDYWEDPLGMVELLVKYDRLPKKLIISIRDNQFKPVELRKDFLWEPGIPAYRVMSEKLGLETESYIKTLPYDRAKAMLSLPMLFENFTRWYNATEHPGPSAGSHFETLDTLLPDGSITWSNKKMRLFTAERTKAESLAFAEKRENDPPVVDPQGVKAFNVLLDFLKEKGVTVYLVNPPFNPIFYDRVQGTPYAAGLSRFETLVQKIATDHHLPLFGSFNPHKLGCTSAMYIDAEHSNMQCLQKIFDQFAVIDGQKGGN